MTGFVSAGEGGAQLGLKTEEHAQGGAEELSKDTDGLCLWVGQVGDS